MRFYSGLYLLFVVLLLVCAVQTGILINSILRDSFNICCVDNYICQITENIPEGIELSFLIAVN